MPSTTSFKRGDVVLVPFPFTDLSTTKQRPALVISSDSFNAARDDLLVAAISSQIHTAPAPEEFVIPPSELGACGLPKPSIVRVAKITALHRRLIIKRLGSMPAPTLAQVLARIRQLF